MSTEPMTQTDLSCHIGGIEGAGPLTSDVVFVGIAPGRDEMRTKEPFTGASGKLLNATLKAFDIAREDIRLTNLICWNKDAPDEEEIAACAPRLEREIRAIQPKVIVALGVLAAKRFTGIARSGDSRGACVWSTEFNCWVISTWHPAAILRGSPTFISDLVRDLAKIDYIKDKSRDFGHVGYAVVQSPVQAQQVLDSDWLRTAPFMALDVECKWDATKGEKGEWTDDIRCLSISDGDVTYCFPESALDGLSWPTENIHWTFHNGMFDTRILNVDQGVDLPICDDTMLMSYSLDERGGSDDENEIDLAVGIHGLKKLAREYCGAGFYEVDLKNSPDDVVYHYNAQDAAYTARLARLFYNRQLADPDTRRVYEQLTLPQTYVSRDEQQHGVYVHKEVLKNVAVSWMEEWLETEELLRKEAQEYGWPTDNFNFNSPIQLKKLINNYLLINVPNCQADTLAPYAGHPFIGKYRRIKRIDKQLGTYVIGTQKVLYPDGRVRPDASLHGTTSGRLTYHRPPIATIPTGAQYVDPDDDVDAETLDMIKEFSQMRAMFGVPPGKKFIEADFEGAELWTAAYYSKDQVMLEDLLSGDFHSRAAEGMFQVSRDNYPSEQWKQIRRESKYVTFGTLFLRGANSLYSPKAGQGGNLGKKYTLREIEAMVVAWHKRYSKHMEWVTNEIREAVHTGEQRNIAGRLRRYHAPGLYGKHFPNMVSNFPIQSTSHDHLILARLEFDAMFKAGTFPARSLWDGHDAVYFECDEDKVDEVCRVIKRVMETPRYFDRGIPVEIKVGTSWADGHVWRG